MPQGATFDTAFHAVMPEHAAHYAIEPELAARHGTRRYGFHALAHRSMLEPYAVQAGRAADAPPRGCAPRSGTSSASGIRRRS
jgi:acetate kinase